MKKLLLLVLLGLMTWSGYEYFYANNGKKIELAVESSRPDARNASFLFEDGEVTLKNGRNDGDDSSFIPTETYLTGEPAYGDINSDKKNDTVVLLVQNSGGSGVFVYIAGYVSGNVAYKGSNAVFVGDRISPTQVTIDDKGVIKLSYLDRAPNDPMSETPTIPKTKSFKYSAGTLEEI